jgi:hypothetical protein
MRDNFSSECDTILKNMKEIARSKKDPPKGDQNSVFSMNPKNPIIVTDNMTLPDLWYTRNDNYSTLQDCGGTGSGFAAHEVNAGEESSENEITTEILESFEAGEKKQEANCNTGDLEDRSL